MARIRSVKPELRTSDLVASWPIEVRYFFVLLWGYLDDKGRGLDTPKQIAGDCFPHDERITPAKIDGWLTLMGRGLEAHADGPVCRYEVKGRRYLHCTNWSEHQKPNRPTPSRLPPCPVHDRLTDRLSESDSEPDTDPSSEAPSGTSVPGIRSSGAGEVGAEEAAAPPKTAAAEPPDSRSLDLARRAVAGVVPAEHPGPVRRQLETEAAKLIATGTPGEIVTAALWKWLAHPNAGPRLLPSLVSDVIRERNGATRDAPRPTLGDKAAGWLALATPTPPQPALPGGAP